MSVFVGFTLCGILIDARIWITLMLIMM